MASSGSRDHRDFIESEDECYSNSNSDGSTSSEVDSDRREKKHFGENIIAEDDKYQCDDKAKGGYDDDYTDDDGDENDSYDSQSDGSFNSQSDQSDKSFHSQRDLSANDNNNSFYSGDNSHTSPQPSDSNNEYSNHSEDTPHSSENSHSYRSKQSYRSNDSQESFSGSDEHSIGSNASTHELTRIHSKNEPSLISSETRSFQSDHDINRRNSLSGSARSQYSHENEDSQNNSINDNSQYTQEGEESHSVYDDDGSHSEYDGENEEKNRSENNSKHSNSLHDEDCENMHSHSEYDEDSSDSMYDEDCENDNSHSNFDNRNSNSDYGEDSSHLAHEEEITQSVSHDGNTHSVVHEQISQIVYGDENELHSGRGDSNSDNSRCDNVMSQNEDNSNAIFDDGNTYSVIREQISQIVYGDENDLHSGCDDSNSAHSRCDNEVTQNEDHSSSTSDDGNKPPVIHEQISQCVYEGDEDDLHSGCDNSNITHSRCDNEIMSQNEDHSNSSFHDGNNHPVLHGQISQVMYGDENDLKSGCDDSNSAFSRFDNEMSQHEDQSNLSFDNGNTHLVIHEQISHIAYGDENDLHLGCDDSNSAHSRCDDEVSQNEDHPCSTFDDGNKHRAKRTVYADEHDLQSECDDSDSAYSRSDNEMSQNEDMSNSVFNDGNKHPTLHEQISQTVYEDENDLQSGCDDSNSAHSRCDEIISRNEDLSNSTFDDGNTQSVISEHSQTPYRDEDGLHSGCDDSNSSFSRCDNERSQHEDHSNSSFKNGNTQPLIHEQISQMVYGDENDLRSGCGDSISAHSGCDDEVSQNEDHPSLTLHYENKHPVKQISQTVYGNENDLQSECDDSDSVYSKSDSEMSQNENNSNSMFNDGNKHPVIHHPISQIMYGDENDLHSGCDDSNSAHSRCENEIMSQNEDHSNSTFDDGNTQPAIRKQNSQTLYRDENDLHSGCDDSHSAYSGCDNEFSQHEDHSNTTLDNGNTQPVILEQISQIVYGVENGLRLGCDDSNSAHSRCDIKKSPNEDNFNSESSRSSNSACIDETIRVEGESMVSWGSAEDETMTLTGADKISSSVCNDGSHITSSLRNDGNSAIDDDDEHSPCEDGNSLSAYDDETGSQDTLEDETCDNDNMFAVNSKVQHDSQLVSDGEKSDSESAILMSHSVYDEDDSRTEISNEHSHRVHSVSDDDNPSLGPNDGESACDDDNFTRNGNRPHSTFTKVYSSTYDDGLYDSQSGSDEENSNTIIDGNDSQLVLDAKYTNFGHPICYNENSRSVDDDKSSQTSNGDEKSRSVSDLIDSGSFSVDESNPVLDDDDALGSVYNEGSSHFYYDKNNGCSKNREYFVEQSEDGKLESSDILESNSSHSCSQSNNACSTEKTEILNNSESNDSPLKQDCAFHEKKVESMNDTSNLVCVDEFFQQHGNVPSFDRKREMDGKSLSFVTTGKSINLSLDESQLADTSECLQAYVSFDAKDVNSFSHTEYNVELSDEKVVEGPGSSLFCSTVEGSDHSIHEQMQTTDQKIFNRPDFKMQSQLTVHTDEDISSDSFLSRDNSIDQAQNEDGSQSLDERSNHSLLDDSCSTDGGSYQSEHEVAYNFDKEDFNRSMLERSESSSEGTPKGHRTSLVENDRILAEVGSPVDFPNQRSNSVHKHLSSKTRDVVVHHTPNNESGSVHFQETIKQEAYTSHVSAYQNELSSASCHSKDSSNNVLANGELLLSYDRSGEDGSHSSREKYPYLSQDESYQVYREDCIEPLSLDEEESHAISEKDYVAEITPKEEFHAVASDHSNIGQCHSLQKNGRVYSEHDSLQKQNMYHSGGENNCSKDDRLKLFCSDTYVDGYKVLDDLKVSTACVALENLLLHPQTQQENFHISGISEKKEGSLDQSHVEQYFASGIVVLSASRNDVIPVVLHNCYTYSKSGDDSSFSTEDLQLQPHNMLCDHKQEKTGMISSNHESDDPVSARRDSVSASNDDESISPSLGQSDQKKISFVTSDSVCVEIQSQHREVLVSSETFSHNATHAGSDGRDTNSDVPSVSHLEFGSSPCLKPVRQEERDIVDAKNSSKAEGQSYRHEVKDFDERAHNANGLCQDKDLNFRKGTTSLCESQTDLVDFSQKSSISSYKVKPCQRDDKIVVCGDEWRKLSSNDKMKDNSGCSLEKRRNEEDSRSCQSSPANKGYVSLVGTKGVQKFVSLDDLQSCNDQSNREKNITNTSRSRLNSNNHTMQNDFPAFEDAREYSLDAKDYNPGILNSIDSPVIYLEDISIPHSSDSNPASKLRLSDILGSSILLAEENTNGDSSVGGAQFTDDNLSVNSVFRRLSNMKMNESAIMETLGCFDDDGDCDPFQKGGLLDTQIEFVNSNANRADTSEFANGELINDHTSDGRIFPSSCRNADSKSSQVEDNFHDSHFTSCQKDANCPQVRAQTDEDVSVSSNEQSQGSASTYRSSESEYNSHGQQSEQSLSEESCNDNFDGSRSARRESEEAFNQYVTERENENLLDKSHDSESNSGSWKDGLPNIENSQESSLCYDESFTGLVSEEADEQSYKSQSEHNQSSSSHPSNTGSQRSFDSQPRSKEVSSWSKASLVDCVEKRTQSGSGSSNNGTFHSQHSLQSNDTSQGSLSVTSYSESVDDPSTILIEEQSERSASEERSLGSFDEDKISQLEFSGTGGKGIADSSPKYPLNVKASESIGKKSVNTFDTEDFGATRRTTRSDMADSFSERSGSKCSAHSDNSKISSSNGSNNGSIDHESMSDGSDYQSRSGNSGSISYQLTSEVGVIDGEKGNTEEFEGSGSKISRCDVQSVPSSRAEDSGSENLEEVIDGGIPEEQQGSMLMPAIKHFYNGYSREQILKVRDDIHNLDTEENDSEPSIGNKNKAAKRDRRTCEKSEVLIELVCNVANAMSELDEELRKLAELEASKDGENVITRQSEQLQMAEKSRSSVEVLECGNQDDATEIVQLAKPALDEILRKENVSRTDLIINEDSPTITDTSGIEANNLYTETTGFSQEAATGLNEASECVGESLNDNLSPEQMQLTSTRLMFCFEAVTGILLRFSDELDLLSTFAIRTESPAIEALSLLLSFAEELNQAFEILKPILLHYITEEIDDELDDFLYGMNLTMDLLCELTHRIGEKQQWSARANTAYVTLLELLARDSLEVSCIYDDLDTPEYPISDLIKEAWSGTGHVEELKTLLATPDLFMFRQICYEVILSTDQWCPDTDTLMDICGIDEDFDEAEKPGPDDILAPAPEAALQILEKIYGDPLPRATSLSSILRRILPAHAITDTLVSEKLAKVRSTVRNPLGMPTSSLVAISSSPEAPDIPDSLGLAGVGKTTVSRRELFSVSCYLRLVTIKCSLLFQILQLAAMVANHEDVRRFFSDGIAWIHVGQTELNYTRYVQCMQDLVSQLEVDKDEEPNFPELLHTPEESLAKRRRREEGFMIYLRETMVEFLRFRNVLVILDDVCFEPDLDWFDFAPVPMPDGVDEEEGSCAILVTSRRRDILPPADTVEVEMLEISEGIELLIRESGELSNAISADSSVTRSVIVQCAAHPLTVKSVARWLNLKHATTGDSINTEKMQEEVNNSILKIVNTELEQDADMMYEILDLSLSPSINGERTKIIKFCFAAFVRVFCEKKYISDFALADFSTIVPMSTTELLFESLLDLEEETLLRDGSLFYAKKNEAATIIPEALSALGVFKFIITYAEAAEGSKEQEVEDEKYLQIMHRIQQEYGEYLYEDDESLTELMKDGELRWNKAFAQAFLSKDVDWDTESPDAGLDYALEMMPTHLVRGGLLFEAATLLCNASFVRGRLFALGRESGTQRHIKDCEILYDVCIAERAAGSKNFDAKALMKQAYLTLGSFLSMEEEDLIREEGSLAAIEMGRSFFWIGFSLAEKRCWEAAIDHWENAQENLVSALGMVELVAGILLNVGVAYAELNDYEKSLGSLKQCLRIRGALHGEEHILYAQTIQKIGDVFLDMSDYHEAMESYNWALDVMHIEPSHHRIDIGDVLENMGNIHFSKGAIEESLQCYEDALRSKQVDLGEDHPELASSFQNIGNCLSSKGKTNEAIAHLEESIRLKKLDVDCEFERNADILTIEGVLNNLMNRQQDGLKCYEKALQILVTKVPHRKEKVASLLHMIGCVYLMSGEHRKAMKLFEESLQARRKILGFVHLDVASTLFNMAFLHQTRNKLDKALKCLEEALKIRQLRLPDSEKAAVTHEKIGHLAKAIGKTKKAEIAFNEALRIRKLIHGDIHEAVATILQELGDLMDDLGLYDAAMKHYVEALEIRENRLGPDDLAVAETYYSMGFTLQNSGGEDRAVQCLEESLSIRKFNLGDDAKEVGDTLNMLGFLQAQRGELNDALSLLWEALRIRKIQKDNVKVSETLNNIGNVHREKAEFEFAIECYEECLRIRRSELGDDSEKVADALVALGNVYSDMDKKDESMDYYKEALMIRNVLFGEQDESVATVLQYMGTLEFRSNELDRAFQLLDDFVRIRQENGTEPDGDFVNALFMIGNIHKMQGYEDEAKKCWKEAYAIFKELGLAQGNPQIAAVMRNLLHDEDFDRPEGVFVGFGNGPSAGGKSMMELLSEKVKSATRTASEAAAAMKNAAGLQSSRGNQLL